MTAAIFLAIGLLVGFVVGYAVAGGFSSGATAAIPVRVTKAPTAQVTLARAPDSTPVPPTSDQNTPDQDALKGSAVLDDILAKDPISEEEELFQNLRLKCLYDDAAVERLIEREKETDPTGSRLELMKAAKLRWERENA